MPQHSDTPQQKLPNTRKVNKIIALSQSPILSDDEQEYCNRMFSEASIPLFYANAGENAALLQHNYIQDYPRTNEPSTINGGLMSGGNEEEDSNSNPFPHRVCSSSHLNDDDGASQGAISGSVN